MSVCSHSEKPYIEWDSSLWRESTQVCRRFTRINVTKQTIKLHHEIYLTPSLDSVLQAGTKVRLMLLSPSTMNYLPVGNLLLSFIKQ